jgi:hypothetical protein
VVRFIDNSELALKPGTTVTIDQFAFDEAKPDADRAAYTLVKGGLRSITGLLGKRNKDKFAMKTPSATIGIRGTTFFLEYLTGKGDVDARRDWNRACTCMSARRHLHCQQRRRVPLRHRAVGFIKDDKTRPVKMFTNPGMQFTPPASFGDVDRLRRKLHHHLAAAVRSASARWAALTLSAISV